MGPRPQGVGAPTPSEHLTHGTLPLASSQHRNRLASSNTQPYDRSHVTGASSSTASSHGGLHHNPPPSMASVRLNHGHHHNSMHSLGRNHRRPRTGYRDYHVKNMPPPPTPASTDINEESESGYAHFGHHHYPVFSSGGYDSEYYGGMASRPHPPTPRSQYDVSDYGDDTLVYPEEEIAFIPPPPSRCETPPAPDEDA